MLLAGDIGGTKTRLAIFSPSLGPRASVREATFASQNYPNLEAIVGEFMERTKLPVERAVFGVPGPVVGGEVTVTNLPWRIQESRLGEVLGVSSVHLVNDLQALAYAVPFLQPPDLHILQAAKVESGGTIAVIAPGTGLGEAYLTWDGSRYRAHASEGGHADFGPTNLLELGLLHYLMERLNHVSYERVCSGTGLANIYAYLKDTGYAQEPPWLAEQLSAVRDPTPVIINAALNHESQPCELAVVTLRMFVSILGAEAGNLALKLMSSGGVYLGGGLPPRILSSLKQGHFMQSFLNKGRFKSTLMRFPVWVIHHPNAALLGIAYYGLGLWDRVSRVAFGEYN